MSRLRILVSICLLLVVNLCAAADTALSLWKISNEQAEVYLFGSFHMTPKGTYPLADEINAAFDVADKVVFEIDMSQSNPQETSALVAEFGLFADSTRLDDVLPISAHKLLADYLAGNGGSIDGVQRMKPWLIGLQIAIGEYAKLGYSTDDGIDIHFQKRARQIGKPVLELETMRMQMALLAADDMTTQVTSLQQALEQIEELPKQVASLLGTWQTGDADGMYDLALASVGGEPKLLEQFNRLLDDRNINMVKQIRGYLETDDNYFVVVGALHMGGPQGILNLLGRDYDVRQIHHSSDR